MTTLLLAWLLQVSGYRIAGVVLNAATRQPVSGANVFVAPVEHRDQRLAFVTGQDGRFAFLGVPQGRYELIAQRRGFLTQGYGQRAGFASAIVTGPDKLAGDLVLPLCQPGAISGRVADDGGEPVEDAVVELFRSTLVNGRRHITTVAAKTTADNGEYRFGSLPPGSYYLAVSGSPWYTKFNQTHGDAAPAAMTRVGYGVQFYPGTANPAAAEPLMLKAGQEAAANFSLLPVSAVALYVHVDGGEELTKEFTLAVAGLPGGQMTERQGTESGDLYTFWGVPPGHYSLRVATADPSQALSAGAEVDVGATDTDVSVTLAKAPSVAGTIEAEGGGTFPSDLSVVLTNIESSVSQSLPVGADGKFSIAVVAPQRCRVALAGGDEYYLKRWSVEGARREGDSLDIREGASVRLKLVAAKGGRVTGMVSGGGRPLAGALVVLAPEGGSARAEDYHATQTASDGSYEIRGVPPGEYAVFAVESGSELEYSNRAAIRPYLENARKMSIASGGSDTRCLDAIANVR